MIEVQFHPHIGGLFLPIGGKYADQRSTYELRFMRRFACTPYKSLGLEKDTP